MGTDIIHGTDRVPPRSTNGVLSSLALRSHAKASYALTTLEQSLDRALVVTPRQDTARPRQLSWNGVRVSEELQRYASCIARGEQLGPYRGPVLARSDAMFPWNLKATPALPAPRRVEAPWSAWQRVVLGLLFIGVLAGGGASLFSDAAAGSSDETWSMARLEAAVVARAESSAVEPAPVVTPEPPVTKPASRSAASAVRANVSARPARTSRSSARANTGLQRPDAASAARADDSTLFVEAPSF
jgi:hypothetical protein